MKSVKSLFQRKDDDDPGTIESIERDCQRKSRASRRAPTLRDIPRLTREMLMQNSKSTSLQEAQEKAIEAAKTLYELCDVGHKSNREPMVASGEYDVIGPLTQCLLHEPIYFPTHHNDGMDAKSSPSMNGNGIHRGHSLAEPRIVESGNDGGRNNCDTDDHAKDETDSKVENSKPMTTTNGEARFPKAVDTALSPSSNRRLHHRIDEKLHFVCLTLNNLSIPHDNKRVMVRERGAKRLIGNLCKVIASGKKEAHLCCIILMNLSFYEAGLTTIGQFSPTRPAPILSSPKSEQPTSPANSRDSPSHENGSHPNGTTSGSNHGTKGNKAKKALATTTTIVKRAATALSKTRKLTPLENPDSLLRVLQDLVSSAEKGTSDFRWAFGLLANLSRHPENALLIGLTGIPRVAIENLKESKIPSSEWATNSLEDFSLYFLLHLSESCPPGSLKGALEVAIPIMKSEGTQPDGIKRTNVPSAQRNHRNGIQNLKATMICAFLGVDWEEFPNHGVIAAGAVSELMGNTFERVGKKAVYTESDFYLRTAVSAYATLAKAASKADASGDATINASGTATTSSVSCVHTKVMALPTSVSLLFKIINAIALHWGEDANKNGTGHGSDSYDETYHWDIKAGDLAVGAIMSLLPALLEGTGEDPPKPSMCTQQACADLSKMFVFFSKKTNSISARARALEVAEKFTESASGSALPLLEASYDLCRNYGHHRLQKNFL